MTRLLTCLLGVGLTLAAAACASSTPPTAPKLSYPGTPAGRQAAWLAGAATHVPIPASELRAHFDAGFLAATTPDALNTSFAGLRTVKLDSITTSSAASLSFVVTADGTKLRVDISVDGDGLISRLHLSPAGPPATVAPALPPGARALTVGVGSPALKATLELPKAAGRVPAVVLVGGSGPSDQNETIGADAPFRDLADGLARLGIATLRYDKRTRDYPSSIDQATFTPTEEYVPDATAAINLLRARPEVDPSRIFVLGHSQGGTFAPLIAKTDPQVAGVILAAAGAEPLGAALVRQVTYLSSLPGQIGAQAKASLPAARQAGAFMDDPVPANQSPNPQVAALLGGAGPTYFLDLLHYNEVATARAIPQPLLLLQGQRDYQVTVPDDLDVWTKGLAGRAGVTVRLFPDADHAFVDGSGPPSPADYQVAGHVDPSVVTDIATWIHSVT